MNFKKQAICTDIYDAENRLVKASPRVLITGSRIYEYEYDYMGRRVKKTEKRHTMPMFTWTIRSFEYDGWNLIRERVEFDGAVSTNQYVWGLDLSGSLQGAGGVGGLLTILSPDSCLLTPAYDANGNVTDLVDTNGAVVAHYEYDPYGNTIAQTGDQADANPYRFSSKYWDGETGFYYYGYRFYNPDAGRWLNRDPIGEKGFNVLRRQHRGPVFTKRSASGSRLYDYNLYAFVQNSPVDAVDYLGLAAICDKLWQCATSWNNRRWSTLQDANRIHQQAIIDQAWRGCYNRLAPSNVRLGVERALQNLGVSGVRVTQGTDLKANVPADILDTLGAAGLTVEEVDTISDEGAWRVTLAAGWELKVYQSSDGSYRAAVGYVTESAAHYLDAAWYLARRAGLAEGYPNSYNAENYGGFWGYDQQALDAVRRYSPCCPGVFAP